MKRHSSRACSTVRPSRSRNTIQLSGVSATESAFNVRSRLSPGSAESSGPKVSAICSRLPE